ncbi:IS110 family RNA-guided transposase [Kineococcus sp. SYSU DK018]|uniref:IS110 family transposase n=1 Tax=Kineococcus sp. SYSU DK018 TaxID=3383139 RepID=UPI003D7EA8A9
MDVDSGVIIGMDPHKRSATIEVLDRAERILGGARFTTDTAGYREMLTAGRAWPRRVWAVEGAGGIGKHLAQRLVADGEQVLDVPAKLSARARVFSAGQGRKTDVTDAHSIALVALRTPVLRRVEVDAENVALRLLVDRRDELGVARSQLINRIHKLLLELLPGGAKVFLTAPQAKALLATVRPRDIVGRTRRSLAAEKIAELAVIDKKIKAAKKELTELITATGSGLLQLNGIGPSGAARLLGDVGDIARFPTKAHFASWNGTAPIDASSGDNNRHRLSRSGNRRINRVLHIMAIVQMRHDTEGRAYYRRKLAAGKTSMEAIRCLERRLSDVVYRQMVADAQATTSLAEPEEGIVDDVAEVPPAEVLLTGPGGQAGAAAGSSATGSDPGAGSSEKSLPGPATSIVATRRRSRKIPVGTRP